MSRIALSLAVICLSIFSCGGSDDPVEPDNTEKTYRFVHYQDIQTSGGADFQSFEIGGDTYLAVANAYDGVTVALDSKIYRWADGSFTEAQAIPTSHASAWEYFTIGGESYLALANWEDDPPLQNSNIDSKVYRWNGALFAEFQSIPTSGAIDWEYFTIGTESYLAVANQHSNYTWDIESKIYRWNGASFEEFQSIPTLGASDWEFFAIGADSFLALANGFYGGSNNVDSKIYRWGGSYFTEHQSIPTNGARDCEPFMIGAEWFLAIANFNNDLSHDIDSKVYRWNGTAFTEYQSIPTNGAIDWEYFEIDAVSYLAVANYTSETVAYDTDSRIYKWNGTSFEEYQAVPTSGATDWEYMLIGGSSYLACTNLRQSDAFVLSSIVLKWTLE